MNNTFFPFVQALIVMARNFLCISLTLFYSNDHSRQEEATVFHSKTSYQKENLFFLLLFFFLLLRP